MFSDDMILYIENPKVKRSQVVQSCPTLCAPMNCSPPDSSVHGISQARILEQVAISFSIFPFQGVKPASFMSPALAGRFFTTSATWEAKTLTFLIEGEMCMSAESLQSCPTLRYSVDCSPSGSLSMGFSRQEYWSGLPCCSPGNLPNPGTEPASLMFPALPGRFFTTSATREAQPSAQSSFKTFPLCQY